MQDKIVDEFKNPSVKYRTAPFWSWNGALDSKELCRQMEDFKAHGIGGAFAHARQGLITEYLSDEFFDRFKDTLEFAKKHSNAVLHCVCGVTDADKLLAADADGLKLLILGFKTHGRGKRYFSGSVVRKINYFSKVLPMICDKFDVISYDNLALKQLHIRERVDEITWNETYGGEDGTDNLYVDLVRGVFAMNSRTNEVFPLLPTAEEMLAFIHKRYNIG